MRRNRALKRGSTYYVNGTINRDKSELKDSIIKNLLLIVIFLAKKKFKFHLKHFVIVDTHVHFIIKPLNDESLSKIMQWIFGVFAMRYNRKMGFRGKVWFDRFKSKIISGIKEFIEKFIRINEHLAQFGIKEHIYNYRYSGVYYLKRKSYFLIQPLPVFSEYLFMNKM